MSPTSNHPLVLAITGASGVIYGQRLLQVLLKTDIDIHLTISPSGAVVLKHEVGVDVDLDNFRVGDVVTISVLQGMEQVTFTVELAEEPN